MNESCPVCFQRTTRNMKSSACPNCGWPRGGRVYLCTDCGQDVDRDHNYRGECPGKASK